MSEYYTGRTGDGVQFPRSGPILGVLAETLGLRADIARAVGAEGLGAKSLQRYFAGDGELAADTAERVRAVVLATLVPSDLGVEMTDLEVLATASLRHVLDRYDDVAPRMNSQAFPVTEPKLAMVPYLRLVALDAGSRWGAYQFLRQLAGKPTEDAPTWLEPRALRRVMDRYRGKLSVDQLAKDMDVSKNTVTAWRDDAVPTREGNLGALAEVLATYSKSPLGLVQLEVRLAAAGAALRRFLDERLGSSRRDRERRESLFRAFAATARITRTHLADQASLGAPPDDVSAFTQYLVAMGAQAPRAEVLCRVLASHAMAAFKKDVALDFASLPRDWFDRLAGWARAIGPIDFQVQRARATEPALAGLTDAQLRELALLPLFDLGHFDEPVNANQVRVLQGPPHIAAANRIQQSVEAMEIGDIEGAIVHARRAVELQPASASAHLALIHPLGKMVADGALHVLDEAIAECRIAHELDRYQPAPLNEIAIILSNARLYGDAERAYAEAAPLCDWWAHHHFGRGLNYLALERDDDARRCFERTLVLAPNHTEAKARLAAVLHHLGDHKGAQKWAKAARLDGHPDPLEDMERLLGLQVPRRRT